MREHLRRIFGIPCNCSAISIISLLGLEAHVCLPNKAGGGEEGRNGYWSSRSPVYRLTRALTIVCD